MGFSRKAEARAQSTNPTSRGHLSLVHSGALPGPTLFRVFRLKVDWGVTKNQKLREFLKNSSVLRLLPQ